MRILYPWTRTVTPLLPFRVRLCSGFLRMNLSSDPLPDRLAWFREARFGMFIHWGLYSLLGRGEWVMNREQIPGAEYRKLADRFTAEHYDPRRWAAIARDAGMRYAVLTTRHHEGFCLWDSRVCSFNAVNSAAKRDLVAEYVEAFRDAGLKVGLYHSLGDWHNPDWKAGYEGDAAAKQRFIAYTHELVRELMTGYGTIDVLWYDLPQNYTPAEWRSVELNAMARRLQPGILINNRAMTTEDFATPEQSAEPSPPGRAWESCMTLNESWGYCPGDRRFKSPRDVIRILGGVAENGGNLLLNVGPDGTGRIPEESVSILREVGDWLREHGEAIYPAERHGMSWNLWGGPNTAAGDCLYVFVSRWFGEELVIGSLVNRVLSAELMSPHTELTFEQEDRRLRIRGLPAEAPDVLVPVVKLTLDGPPRQDFTDSIGAVDIFPIFPA